MILTMREISQMYAKKQPQQVDYLTEASPVLDTVTFQPTTHGIQHAFSELVEASGAGFVDMDSPLPKVDAGSTLKYMNLSILGGEHEVGVDKAKQLGGMGKYMSSKQPQIFSKTGQNAESVLIYDQFEKYAKEQSKLKSASASSSGSIYYSIYAIRWQAGNFTGLFDPKGFGKGALLEPVPLSGGKPYKNSDGVAVYGIQFKSYLGFLFANPRNIAGIVNIDRDNLPTNFPLMMDDMLSDCRAGDGGKTLLYMHRKLLNALGDFKDKHLVMNMGEKNVSRAIGSWDGIPIVTSYNFKAGTEAFITL